MMHRMWDRDIVFAHPQNGRTVVLQDTGAAIVFLFEDWAWAEGPEFRNAVEACSRVMELGDDASHETARQAVAMALMAAGVNLR